MDLQIIPTMPAGRRIDQAINWEEEHVYRVDLKKFNRLKSLPFPHRVYVYTTDKNLYLGSHPEQSDHPLMTELYKLLNGQRIHFIRAWRCRNEVIETNQDFQAWLANRQGFSVDYIQLAIISPKDHHRSAHYLVFNRRGLEVARHYIYRDHRVAQMLLNQYDEPDLFEQARVQLRQYISRQLSKKS